MVHLSRAGTATAEQAVRRRDHGRGALDRGVDRNGVTYVSGHYLGALVDPRPCAIEVADQHPDVLPLTQQRGHDALTEQTASTGDGDHDALPACS